MAARLGRQIDHSNYVDVQNIRACFSQCGEYRYLLTIPYNSEEQRTEVISVILKNPSSADENSADTSVNRVENYVHRKFSNCRELRILNLFAYRATDPRDLKIRIEEEGFRNAVGSANDRFLRDSFHNSAHIIVAWGSSGKIAKSHYDNRIAEVHRLLRSYRDRLCQVEDLCYPKHAQVWGYEDRCYRYQWGRVDDWRGGVRSVVVAVSRRLSQYRCLAPRHRSVSSRRSSNRTCGSPASGSRSRS